MLFIFFFTEFVSKNFMGDLQPWKYKKKFRRRLEFPWLMGVMGQIVGQISNTEYDVL